MIKRSFDNLETKLIKVKSITKVTKGGRKQRFSALVVAGDKNGTVGYGTGKSVEVPVAVKKATDAAKKNAKKVIDIQRTIFHEVMCHEGATKVLIKPAPKGTGILAGGPIKNVIELVGIKDLCSKKLGSSNSVNMIRATIKCLQAQRNKETIAAIRGKNPNEIFGHSAKKGIKK